MPRGLRFSTAVHRTFSNNFRTRKNPISQARKRPGSYPILPPPRAIPNPIPTTPKPDLPVKNGDPGLKTGYFFTLLRKTDEYRWGSYEADASPTMVNVTAAVSDRRRGKRPPRLTAYAYVQRRAAPGVTRHYTFAACYLSRVRENERSCSAAQPGGNAAAMDHGPWAAQRWRQFSCPPRCLSRLRLCAAPKPRRIPAHHGSH